MTDILKEFKKSIPKCNCHCGQCCQCDRPYYKISISKKLKDQIYKYHENPENAHRALMECVHIMEIPGAIGMFTEHE